MSLFGGHVLGQHDDRPALDREDSQQALGLQLAAESAGVTAREQLGHGLVHALDHDVHALAVGLERAVFGRVVAPGLPVASRGDEPQESTGLSGLLQILDRGVVADAVVGVGVGRGDRGRRVHRGHGVLGRRSLLAHGIRQDRRAAGRDGENLLEGLQDHGLAIGHVLKLGLEGLDVGAL